MKLKIGRCLRYFTNSFVPRRRRLQAIVPSVPIEAPLPSILAHPYQIALTIIIFSYLAIEINIPEPRTSNISVVLDALILDCRLLHVDHAYRPVLFVDAIVLAALALASRLPHIDIFHSVRTFILAHSRNISIHAAH